MQQDNKEQKTEPLVKIRELTQEQLTKLTSGMQVKDITLMPGWKIVENWLKSRAFHAWVDPRGLSKEEWEWAELNAFHSADVAKEILQEVYDSVQEAEQLEDYRLGKDIPNPMRI